MGNKIEFKIVGMHCQHCSEIILKALSCLPIEVLEISWEKNTLTCITDNEELIIDKIMEVGYGVEKITGKNNAQSSYKNIAVGISILLGFYLIIKNTIGFNFTPQFQEEASYVILFILGLVTSLHCLSMCGGIVLSQSMALENPIKSTIAYNGGRVLAYTIVGVLVGGIGSVISFSSLFKGYITIFAGGFMLLLGLSMLNPFSFLRKYIKFPGFLNFSNISFNKKTPFYIGLATGLMPCGPLQTMQLYALGTGSMVKGGLSMFVFSLGTVPLMMGLGTVSGYISNNLNRKLLKLSGVLVIALGVIMVNRGLAIQGRVTVGQIVFKQTVTEAMYPEKINGFQVIRTTANTEGYQPNYFILEKDTTVKWMIKGEVLNECNDEIILHELGISKKLQEGHNLLEFTPLEEGELNFSCSLGKLKGTFIVVEDINNVPEDIKTIPARNIDCCTR